MTNTENTSINLELEGAILIIEAMIDGLTIGIERAKELREKFIFDYEPFENSEALTFSLESLIVIFENDRIELKAQMKEAKEKLNARSQ